MDLLRKEHHEILAEQGHGRYDVLHHRLRGSASPVLKVTVFAANLWNSLPVNLTSAPSLTIFQQRLKTHLFRHSYPDLII